MDLNNDTVVLSSVRVKKRDNQTTQEFHQEKIVDAIKRACIDAKVVISEVRVTAIVFSVLSAIGKNIANGEIEVEKIQTLVEDALMDAGLNEVARSYILYREKRKELRDLRLKPDSNAISDYVHPAKYARYIPEYNRRELFEETVTRVQDMHLRKFSGNQEFCKELRWAFSLVKEKKVLPSMRSMQFGGSAIEINNNRGYNCSATFIDRPRAFAEALFLLLSGCGVGYSIQVEHVEKLPTLKFIDTKNVVHHTIQDSIEGWADSLDRLINSYIRGYLVEFNYSKIRAAGEPLKTSGGKAPGHLGLKKALEQIRSILDEAQGRKLRPIECHDILCLAAEAVLSGGIRRSAMISLFSLEDGEMINAKTGNWYKKYKYREYANNSVVLKRDEIKKKQFKRIFDSIREYGEPGFFFVEDYEYATNPCAEIGLNPKLIITEEILQAVEKKKASGQSLPQLKLGNSYTGWAMCNLCEINASKLSSFEDFERAAKAAIIIGTAQAAYTKFPYLGWVSELIVEREALLGVGMTGIMDSPDIALNAEYQKTIATKCIEWNTYYSQLIGINPAARITTVKPSGTTSLALGCVGSGIHPHHARRYFRRIVADELEPVFQYFKSINPHMCVKKPDGKWVIEFPVEAPEGAIISTEVPALAFLEKVKSTQINWVVPGTARPNSSPGLKHNVSNTCIVNPDEWDSVAEYIWANKEHFTGISLLPRAGDKIYAFAPREAVTTAADEAKWNYLITNYRPVDYSTMVETEDSTNLSGEGACVGGACEV